jgi:hypothetical protein
MPVNIGCPVLAAAVPVVVLLVTVRLKPYPVVVVVGIAKKSKHSMLVTLSPSRLVPVVLRLVLQLVTVTMAAIQRLCALPKA